METKVALKGGPYDGFRVSVDPKTTEEICIHLPEFLQYDQTPKNSPTLVPVDGPCRVAVYSRSEDSNVYRFSEWRVDRWPENGIIPP